MLFMHVVPPGVDRPVCQCLITVENCPARLGAERCSPKHSTFPSAFNQSAPCCQWCCMHKICPFLLLTFNVVTWAAWAHVTIRWEKNMFVCACIYVRICILYMSLGLKNNKNSTEFFILITRGLNYNHVLYIYFFNYFSTRALIDSGQKKGENCAHPFFIVIFCVHCSSCHLSAMSEAS